MMLSVRAPLSRGLIGALAVSLAVAAAALAAPGGIQFLGAVVDGVDGADGLDGAYGLAVSPDDEHLYAITDSENSIVTLERIGGGALSFTSMESQGVDGVDGMQSPSAVAMAPDGDHVYVAASTGHSLVTFSRDVGSGELTYEGHLVDDVDGVDGLGSPCCQISVSPDGRHLYVAASGDSAVGVFDLDEDTGEPSFKQVLVDGVDGVDGLSGAIGVTVAPNGRAVYATGNGDDAVVAFKRRGNGMLEFLNARFDDVGPVRGMMGPCCSVAVSPDGRNVYVPTSDDDSIVAFKRAKKSGKLQFLRAYFNGKRGIEDMDEPLDVVVAPDGRDAYAAGYLSHSVARFARKRDGLLSFKRASVDGTGGIENLEGSWRLAMPSNGRNVYSAAYDDDAVVAFKRLR